MSSWLIAFIGIVYLVVAVDLFFFKANPGLGIAFFGYAIGNVGLYLETMKLSERMRSHSNLSESPTEMVGLRRSIHMIETPETSPTNTLMRFSETESIGKADPQNY